MNRLTADVFQEIVASLRSDGSKRSQEKRNRPRVGLRSSLEIFPCTTDVDRNSPMIVWVRDVSADGLGFVGPSQLPLDTQLIAEFDRYERERLRVQYRVAYCKMIARGLYSVGARLVKVLPEKTRPQIKIPAIKSA